MCKEGRQFVNINRILGRILSRDYNRQVLAKYFSRVYTSRNKGLDDFPYAAQPGFAGGRSSLSLRFLACSALNAKAPTPHE
jgi:hypothetical protein